MAIGRPLNLTANVASKNISVLATAGQTSFTVAGGYRINEIAVYRNGTRLVDGRDFTATDGSIVTLVSAATLYDVIEYQIFDSFNIADALNSVGNQTIDGNLTATSFYGDGSNLSNIISGVGVNSGGTNIGYGVTTLHFVGSGTTIEVSGTTANISAGGGGGGGASKVYSSTIFAYQNIVQSDITIASPYLTGTIYASEDVTVDIEDGVTVTVDDGAVLSIITI